ncbi:hypothetical protein M514_01954 [Trichuris suis]|uniref:Uncharacterized protein n=1 Tax=Trichuris suis TaxID=68888 RepID=A0A085NJE4_9BILA|nr:hypothetical protein M513_01954 [Trichuris suis]KFD69590.1 hypothetical protein M514_01954 [Trichuris suis]
MNAILRATFQSAKEAAHYIQKERTINQGFEAPLDELAKDSKTPSRKRGSTGQGKNAATTIFTELARVGNERHHKSFTMKRSGRKTQAGTASLINASVPVLHEMRHFKYRTCKWQCLCATAKAGALQ